VAQCRKWREKTESRTGTVSLQQVLDAVASAFKMPREHMTQPGRHGNRGRDAAIGLARELVDDPLETLAEHFGGVSRSAITETARRARQRAEREPAFAALLDEIRRELRR
jgi:chromosomal replication initiation ATPase DnaA